MYLAILGTASIPLSLYLLRSYGELLRKSMVFIKEYYPSVNTILLICLLPLVLITTFVAGYAKSEDYLLYKKTNNKNFKGIFHYIIILIVLFFLLYNIFNIYVYVKYIGGNPFLSWKEFLNFRK